MGFQGLARMGLADPRDQLARAVLQQGISTLQHQTRVQQLQAQALRNAAREGQPFCAECEAARVAYQALMA